MAREILFKAKRADNGEWVEGFYFEFKGKNYITEMLQTFMTTYYTEESVVDFNMRAYEVEAETICQYTGLTDKNGKKIWENDIVTEDFGNFKGTVRFGEFEAQVLKNIGFCIEWKDIYYRQDLCYWAEKCEIIGNIFDNPDLLEENHE